MIHATIALKEVKCCCFSSHYSHEFVEKLKTNKACYLRCIQRFLSTKSAFLNKWLHLKKKNNTIQFKLVIYVMYLAYTQLIFSDIKPLSF